MIKMRAGFQGDVSRQQLLNCGGKQASGSEFFSLHQFSQKARTACSSQALSRTNSEKKKTSGDDSENMLAFGTEMANA